ncbi:MAG: 3-(2,3-dihydroxyphenyl)propionate dioxygenase [Hirschia sp.]|nr:3-(2,3-dihydroxyphenyl)propionate dioxygenase [Hirschia sp.]MBB37291.1 3-(2,3-dihydroxyphenyl)propionate dioxygenase [Hirschia sp.]
MTLKLICAAHTPLMDHVETDPTIDARVRAQFAALADEVAAYDPELIIIFGPDHFKGFFYEMLPAFTIGVRATAIGDYDIGSGEYDVPEALALDCIRSVHKAGVDVGMSYRMRADHGFSQLLVLLSGKVDRYPVLPVHINCAGPPLPPFGRVRVLGTAVGQWASQQNKRILILGSGGLSHDPPIPQLLNATPVVAEKLIAAQHQSVEERRAREEQNYEAARALARGEGESRPLSPAWDRDFMDRMARGDLGYLDDMSDDALTELAGCGGHEVRNWLAAYSALAASGPYRAENLLYYDIAHWNAGMGIATAEPKVEAITTG